ncbi:hypothetical protein [Natronomonas aquatica]|jgi:hypothetical protein
MKFRVDSTHRTVTFPDPADRNVLAETCERCPALAESRERIA